jgi:hypothetical protein
MTKFNRSRKEPKASEEEIAGLKKVKTDDIKDIYNLAIKMGKNADLEGKKTKEN